jgi:hypothetical protein
MGRLENLITSLVDKLDSELPKLGDSNGGTPGSNDSFDEEQDPEDSTHPGVSAPKFFGTQSTFSVLSARGIQWLELSCRDPGLFDRFQSFHQKATAAFLVNNKMWLDPISKSELRPIPAKHIVMPLLDRFFTEAWIAQLFMSKEEVTELFDRYYHMISNQQHSFKKRLTNSDLLSINIILATSAILSMEASSLRDPETTKMLQRLEQNHIENSVFYFHRIATISEGIRTIQALILMTVYSEFAKCSPQAYILVSTMVRYAQEMGLHRRETLVGLSEDETILRRRLWICVYVLDREFCFRSGKPPIINANDVSSVTPSQYAEVLFYKVPQETIQKITDPDFDLLGALENMSQAEYLNSAVENLMRYHYARVIDFTSVIYEKLFSANSLKGISRSQMMDIIEDLGQRLTSLFNKLPRCVRPGADLSNIKSHYIRYNLSLSQLQFYSCSMTIHKMAFSRTWITNHEATDDWENIPPLQKKLMMTCLDDARSIMSFVKKDPQVNPIFSNLVMFEFISAFFTLFACIIEYPTAPFVRSDLDFIATVRDVLLAKHAVHCQNTGETLMYGIVNFSVRFFMRIAIMVYNNANVDIIDLHNLNMELNFWEAEIAKMSEVCSSVLKSTDPIFTVLASNSISVPLVQGGADLAQPPLLKQSRAPSIPTIMNPLPDDSPLGKNLYGKNMYVPTPKSETSLPLQNGMGIPNGGISASHTPGLPDVGAVNATPLDNYLNQFSLEDFEIEKNSTILQHIFSIPNVFLNTSDADDYNCNPTVSF